MRKTVRTIAIAGGSAFLLLAAPLSAHAAEPDDVAFSFAVTASGVTNTISNASGVDLLCTTSLASTVDGVLPPVDEVIQNGPTLYASGQSAPGNSTQEVTDVPAGSYVVLASCALTEGDATTVWISDYPGLDEYLTPLPWTSHIVQQASPVVTIAGDPTPPNPVELPDLGSIIGSGSAN
nr:hypothetical protein [Rhodococcus sp. (in: high G+C Gram-positive bacteria)]